MNTFSVFNEAYSRVHDLFIGLLLSLLLQTKVYAVQPDPSFFLEEEGKEKTSLVSPSSTSPTMGNESPNPPFGAERIPAILDFWFGSLHNSSFFPQKKLFVWFVGSPEIDRQIRDNFSQDVIYAARGAYNRWRETPHGRLALILLLDQFPRDIYRDTPRALMLDRMARGLVLEGLHQREDRRLYPIERAFFYLPLEHSEDPVMQALAVACYQQLFAESPPMIRPQMQSFLQSAIMHQRQIARFGRFPHRNAILGRKSTPEEVIFLRQQRSLIFQ